MRYAKIDDILANKTPFDSSEAKEAINQILCDPDDGWDDSIFPLLHALKQRGGPGSLHTGLYRTPDHIDTIIEGDLHIDGDFECSCHTFVTGNLTCSGYLYSGIHCNLVVAGDIRARAIDAWQSYWLVGGSITADSMWFSSDGFVHHHDRINARLLVLEQGAYLVNDAGVKATTRIESDYLPNDEEAEVTLRATIIPDVYESLLYKDGEFQGQFDQWEMLRRLSRGDAVFV